MSLKWDIRFIRLAREVASWSKDPSTQTGAVIVRPDRTVVSLGFNGFPQSMPDAQENYANREEKYSRIVHCEMNAVLFAKEILKGCTLYTWPALSCDRCVVHMIQAGIAEFVYPEAPEDMKSRWQPAFDKTLQYLGECGLQTREISREDWEAVCEAL